MKAAVVSSFDSAPVYTDVPAPKASGPDELVVDVLAAALHPRVRSQADGSHYTSTDELPLVPGIDGVGRDSSGTLRYFILPDTALGSMAQQTVIDRRRSIPLPDDTDPILVAAAMNPAMSSWLALRSRMQFERGQSVLVLGATGSAGRLAVQVARFLGADRIVAAGRDSTKLAALTALGATATTSIAGDPDDVARAIGETASDVDAVLDYLWGEPAAAAITGLVTARGDRSRPLTWIEIGSVAGRTSPIPSAALRAADLRIVGSGQGSVPTRDILAALPQLATTIAAGAFQVDAVPVPLADVATAWADTATTSRVVLTP
ncbi:zinc-binding alcohol dehydrogenase family protein [Leifsonia lichenia]